MDRRDLSTRVDELERDQAQLHAALKLTADALKQAEVDRDGYHALYLQMIELCRKLERGLLGKTAEKLPVDSPQLSFEMLSMMIGERERAEIAALASQTVRAHERQKPTGRQPLPEALPRVDIEIVPDEVQREGLDAFVRIGQDVTEVLERRPASLVVARIIKPKFVRKDRDREHTQVLVGKTPALPIERGLAGPGMLADTIVRRWQDHLPLHRLEGIYARDGIELARSTMCTWHETLAELALPLIAAMRKDAFTAPYLCTDATGVLVQAKEQCRRGHFWVLVAPGRHVLFEFSQNHTKDAVDAVLGDYQGYLVADAHVVYDHLYARGRVIEVNCWAHARRYFFKALASEPERARFALDVIGQLFTVERSIAHAPRKKREAARQKYSAAVVERFFAWCDAQWPSLLEGSPLYDGVRYARNQRVGLHRFLRDGRLPLDNNISERELRRQAVGRKNWIFVGSEDGAQANAVFTSLLASCRMLGLEPWAYLRDLFCLLPTWPANRLLELAPVNFAKTTARADVQDILTANPYRALTFQRG